MSSEQPTPSPQPEDLTTLVLSVPGVTAVYPSAPTPTRIARAIAATLGTSPAPEPIVNLRTTNERTTISARVATQSSPAPTIARDIADHLRSAHPDKSARITVQIASITI